jgi:hypothetical protein
LIFNTGKTTSGNNVAVSPIPTATLTFGNITSTGQTVVTPLDSASTTVPANFQVATSTGGFATYFDIDTSASFTGPIEFAIAYDPEQFPYDSQTNTWTNGQPMLLHDPNATGTWNDNATSAWVSAHGADVTIGGDHIVNGVDPVSHKVYGQTTSLSPFAVVRRLAYTWSGILQPINTDGSSVFKKGSTIPVKFKLTGADAGVTNLNAKLYLSQSSSVDPVEANEAISTGAADSGNTFRYDTSGHQYIFNLSTKNLTQGTWYLRVDLGDGVNHTVKIGLKK